MKTRQVTFNPRLSIVSPRASRIWSLGEKKLARHMCLNEGGVRVSCAVCTSKQLSNACRALAAFGCCIAHRCNQILKQVNHTPAFHSTLFLILIKIIALFCPSSAPVSAAWAMHHGQKQMLFWPPYRLHLLQQTNATPDQTYWSMSLKGLPGCIES